MERNERKRWRKVYEYGDWDKSEGLVGRYECREMRERTVECVYGMERIEGRGSRTLHGEMTKGKQRSAYMKKDKQLKHHGETEGRINEGIQTDGKGRREKTEQCVA